MHDYDNACLIAEHIDKFVFFVMIVLLTWYPWHRLQVAFWVWCPRTRQKISWSEECRRYKNTFSRQRATASGRTLFGLYSVKVTLTGSTHSPDRDGFPEEPAKKKVSGPSPSYVNPWQKKI